MTRKLVGFVCLVVVSLVYGTLAVAQTSSAKISGVVADQSGGVLPGVQVTVRNVGTGVARNFTTDERGRYTAPELVPGAYEVTASLTGFETLKRSGITL